MVCFGLGELTWASTDATSATISDFTSSSRSSPGSCSFSASIPTGRFEVHSGRSRAMLKAVIRAAATDPNRPFDGLDNRE